MLRKLKNLGLTISLERGYRLSPRGEAYLRGGDHCYLMTTGRVSGSPHEIEIWFAPDGDTLYLLSGGGDRSDWVRNLRVDAAVTVRLGDRTYEATARVLEAGTDEDARARTLVFDKYQPRSSGSLEDWRERALPVALDLSAQS